MRVENGIITIFHKGSPPCEKLKCVTIGVVFFCFFGSPADAGGAGILSGHVVDLFQWTSLVVCFLSPRRDPQALCQAVLPTV